MQIGKIINKINNGRMNIIIPAVIIVLGILIRLKLLLLNIPYGQDACALSSSLYKHYINLFKPLNYFQIAPPFFMVFSSAIVKSLGSDFIFEVKDMLLRLLPFFCGVFSIPLFLIFLNKISENKYFKYICLFLFSFNYLAIMYSVQFKQYTLELMITLILLNIFYSFDIKDVSLKKIILFSFLLSFVPWCSHTSFVIIFAGFIKILVDCIKNKYFDIKKFVLLLFPMAISFGIFFILYYIPITMSPPYSFMQIFWKETIPSFFTFSNFINMFGNKTEKILQFHMNGYFYILFFIINSVILILRKNYKEVILVIIPILFCIISSFMCVFPYEGRMLLFALPLFIILSCQFMLIIKNQAASYLTAIIVFIYLFFTGYIKQIDEYYNLSDLFYSRNILKVLKEKNPEYKNIITEDIVSGHYLGDINLYSDELMHHPFKDSQTKLYLEEFEPGEYWIVAVMNFAPFKDGFIKYMEDNKDKYEVINIYNDETNNNFIGHIRKL